MIDHLCCHASIGEEKVTAVSRLFFFSFVAAFDNFCPSVRPSVRPNRIQKNKNTAFYSILVEMCEGPKPNQFQQETNNKKCFGW
jgi:hypothetical protein